MSPTPEKAISGTKHARAKLTPATAAPNSTPIPMNQPQPTHEERFTAAFPERISTPLPVTPLLLPQDAAVYAHKLGNNLDDIQANWADFHRQPGILAVSGGADSVALLRLAVADKIPCTIAHLDHQLRATSADDANFVRQLAEKFGLPCHLMTANIAEIARSSGDNLEATARKVRYQYLAKLAQEYGYHWVATAHHADDQIETMLHRLIRGTGLTGLRGIPAVRRLASGVTLVRPLLGISRTKIIAYLNHCQQLYCHDASNDDIKLTRNRLRHEVIPVLKGLNPGLARTFETLAHQASDWQILEERLARRLHKASYLGTMGEVHRFERAPLRLSSSAQVAAMFRRFWHLQHWPTGELTYRHWQRLTTLAQTEQGPNAIDFPGPIRSRRGKRFLKIEAVA